jgi:hypothetical protein
MEEDAMLTLQDCLGLCDLTADEVDAIAEHEHVPEIVAAGLGHYLVVTPDGHRRIKRIILDDIAAASARGDRLHALKLKLVLKTFCDTHPECPRASTEAPRQTQFVG